MSRSPPIPPPVLPRKSTMSRLQPFSDAIPRSISFATSIPITPGNMATLRSPMSSLNFSLCTASGAVTGCFFDFGIGNWTAILACSP